MNSKPQELEVSSEYHPLRPFLTSECAIGFVHEVLFVAKEADAKDSPHVVDEVRIIEIDAPAFPLWRKAAQEQHSGVLRQERNERMPLHPIRASLDVLSVQIHSFWGQR